MLSDAWNRGGAGEFIPYNRAAQAELVADATAERLEAKNKNLDFYLKNTRFHWLCDTEGLHLFIVSGENELDKYRVLNSGAGALEIFISPGMERDNYYQFIIGPPGNRIDFYDKNSIHRSCRKISDRLKSETISRDNKMGTYVFIPWYFFYDRLPFDTGSNWRFNVIRWTPAGGISWGGRVHELGRMGELAWSESNPAVEQAVRERIAEYGIARYRKDRERLLEHWNDPELGDPEFCAGKLVPAFGKLDAAVAGYRPGDLSAASGFYRDVLPDLMSADYVAQELRKQYLSDKIISQK